MLGPFVCQPIESESVKHNCYHVRRHKGFIYAGSSHWTVYSGVGSAEGCG